jgi:hypothetical protein
LTGFIIAESNIVFKRPGEIKRAAENGPVNFFLPDEIILSPSQDIHGQSYSTRLVWEGGNP